jgi:tetratricopeptide (TPR) repeat protein
VTPKLSRLNPLAVVLPLATFAALFAILTLVNRGSDAEPSASPVTTLASGPGPGSTAELISDLRQVVAAGEGGADAYAQLGNAYYQRSRETGDPALLDRADRAFASALATDPMDSAALAGQATVALSRHRFADGLELAQRAHRAAPGVVAPYAALVDGLVETGRYEAAGRALDRMLSLKPTQASYLRLSYYRELHGDLDGAAQALRFATSAGAGTVEGNAYVRSLRGDFEAARGNYAAALYAYREALSVDPEYGNALRGIALLRAGQGDHAAAIEALREQLGDPPSPDILIKLGEVEQAAGRDAAASRHYEQGLAIEEELLDAGAGIDAGITLNVANHGDSGRAVELGRAAWRTAPSVSSADALSWALYRDGRIEAAARMSAEAMRLGSRDPEFLYHAGMIAKANGDLAQAERVLAALEEQSPRFNALYSPRARAALAGLRDNP